MALSSHSIWVYRDIGDLYLILSTLIKGSGFWCPLHDPLLTFRNPWLIPRHSPLRTRHTNPEPLHPSLLNRHARSRQLGIILIARERIMTIVKSEIVLSIIINILARRVSGKASVGLKAVAVLYPRYR